MLFLFIERWHANLQKPKIPFAGRSLLYTCTQRFRALRSVGIRITKLSTNTETKWNRKAPRKHVHTPNEDPIGDWLI